MRTYLVTGGAGFIGSNYIHYMFKKYDNDIRIINVDALTYAGNLENLKSVEERENYIFVKADICDKAAISKIFAENDIDRVVHFAAESHVDRSIRNPEVFVQTNVLGTACPLSALQPRYRLRSPRRKVPVPPRPQPPSAHCIPYVLPAGVSPPENFPKANESGHYFPITLLTGYPLHNRCYSYFSQT